MERVYELNLIVKVECSKENHLSNKMKAMIKGADVETGLYEKLAKQTASWDEPVVVKGHSISSELTSIRKIYEED